MPVLSDYPVPNTFGFSVKASRWVEFSSEDELPDLLARFTETELSRLWMVGRGSNLLFLGDYDGIILHSAITGIRLDSAPGDEAIVRVGSGVVWDDFVAWAVARNLYGAENLSLIPGETGAAAVQNIGAYGVEVSDLIVEVRGWDIAQRCFRTFPVAECGYGYRESIFKATPLHNRFVVTEVTLRLWRSPRYRLDYGNLRSQLPASGFTLRDVRQAVINIRNSKLPDPALTGNAGSFFKNPVIPLTQFEALQSRYPDIPHYPAGDGLVKVPAAWLIEQCGWKGQTLGGAGVWERQPLVLVNRGDALPSDIVTLSDRIIASIVGKFGITVSPEVNFVQ